MWSNQTKMAYTLVADSCCDLTTELRTAWGVKSVPLTLTLGEDSYTDDDSLDLPDFMARMKACKTRIGSAAPSPGLYAEAFGTDDAFAVTLSSSLSGSYASAMSGKEIAEEAGFPFNTLKAGVIESVGMSSSSGSSDEAKSNPHNSGRPLQQSRAMKFMSP